MSLRLMFCTWRSAPRHSRHHVEIHPVSVEFINKYCRCIFRVLNTSSATPIMISPLTDRYPWNTLWLQRLSSMTEYGRATRDVHQKFILYPSSKTTSLDFSFDSRMNGVFPNSPSLPPPQLQSGSLTSKWTRSNMRTCCDYSGQHTPAHLWGRGSALPRSVLVALPFWMKSTTRCTKHSNLTRVSRFTKVSHWISNRISSPYPDWFLLSLPHSKLFDFVFCHTSSSYSVHSILFSSLS